MENRGDLEVSSNVPPRDKAIGDGLRAYQNVRHATFCGFDEHDGGGDGIGCGALYCQTRFGESSQVHRVGGPLSFREQKTFADEPIKQCCPNPKIVIGDGSPSSYAPPPGFVYGHDAGGDENVQFYLYNARSSDRTLLTDGSSMNYSVRWCDVTGERVAFSSNKRDGKHFDVYVLRPDTMECAMVLDMTDRSGYTVVKSFEGDRLLVQHYVSVTDSRLLLLTVPSASDWGRKEAERVQIAPGKGTTAAVSNGVLIPGGVLFSSDEGTPFKSLRHYDLLDDRGEIGISVEMPQWDVEAIYVGREGDVIVSYNEGGRSEQYYSVLSKDKTAPPLQVPLKKLPWDLCGVLSGGGFCKATGRTRHFGFSVLLADGPSDVFVADFGATDDPLDVIPTQFTRSEVGGLNRSKFVQPHLIKYKSFDGLEIPAFLYCPKHAVTKSKSGSDTEEQETKRLRTSLVPVIVHPHGGPEGQHRPRFNPFYQYLVLELGVCIIDPNVRGSSGYGKEFVSLDNCEKREDSVKDIGALLHWIDSQGDFQLDPQKMAVWGGSYGGYMALASLITYSSRFACGVDVVGISNFVTFLENTAEYRRDLRRLKYGDERDPAMRKVLNDISPLTNAEKIAAPLFVVQGAKDPRVPQTEAEQIFKKAKENGQEVWWMLARNEGHGFRKKSNVDAMQEAIIQFFRKFAVSET